MQRNRHSSAFREQALAKARDRGNRTLEAVAREINISLGTLKRGLLSCPATWRQPSGAPHSAYEPCAAHTAQAVTSARAPRASSRTRTFIGMSRLPGNNAYTRNGVVT